MEWSFAVMSGRRLLFFVGEFVGEFGRGFGRENGGGFWGGR